MTTTASDPREAQIREIFWAELDERLPTLNRALLRLERAEMDPPKRASALGELFREAHNLKAAARTVDQVGVEDVASSLETSVAEARRTGEQAPAATWFDAAYALVDKLTELRGGKEQSPQADEQIDFPVDPPVVEKIATSQVTPPTMAVPAVDVQRAALVSNDAGHRSNLDSVRVAVEKLDALLTQTGELTVAHLRIRQRQRELRVLRDRVDLGRREWRNTRGLRAALGRSDRPSAQLESLLHLAEQGEQRSEALLQAVDDLLAQFSQDTIQLGTVTRALEDDVMSVRLLPISSVYTLLDRTLRDLVRTTGKEARLVLEGGETEIDRRILEQVRDPLMHMLRNAVDHGIETPEARLAAGKPRAGTAHLSAALRGGSVQIEMSDDGGGLDPDVLRASAVREGLLSEEQASAMDDVSIMDIIFHPGFSTRTTVSELSGRGVGLDIVRHHVEQLNGQVRVSSQRGLGTRFELRVPLTLATTRAILLVDGGQTFALPSALIERSGRVRQQDIQTFEGRQAVTVEGRPVPVLELATILQRSTDVERRPLDWRSLFIVRQGERRLVILTDHLVGEQEIVVKSLGWPLSRVPNVSGAAVLGSGETVVILNPSDVLQNGMNLVSAPHLAGGARPGAMAVRHVPRILCVDDSLTTRTLMCSILQAAGYDVLPAGDGMAALTVLHAEAIDLVVTDVEMPRMDGYQLTEAIRRDERLRQIPVILVTSLADTDHQQRGVAAGADAYIVKRDFVQAQLLDTVGRLL